MLAYIVWDPMREIIKDIQPPVWYSVLFAAGFVIGYQIMIRIFKKEGHSAQDVDTLTVFMVVSTIIGARFGHLAFYEPERFLADPLMFFRTWEGGLASHGAAFGILIALYLYSNYYIKIGLFPPTFKARKQKRKGQSYLWIVDRIVITVALAAVFIRLGNFVNSEIVGKPTESNYGVVFGRVAEELFEKSNFGIESAEASKGNGEALRPGIVPVDIRIVFENPRIEEAQARRIIENNVRNSLINNRAIGEHYTQPEGPLSYDFSFENRKAVAIVHTYGISRHPTQLYESFTSLILFMILMGLWMKYQSKVPEGLFLGIFLIWIFGLRWVHELYKENQVAFEDDMTYNMGQLLSIPLVALGVFLLVRVYVKSKKV